MLQVKPIETGTYGQGDDFEGFLVKHLSDVIKEKQIIAVTSKLVSLAENRVIARDLVEKEDLIKQEADRYIGKCAYDCHLTIKHGLLIASAGIDESNSKDNGFIIYPKNPFESAKRICEFLKKEFKINELGVLLTDSKTVALRRGVTGIALAYYGFKGVHSQVGSKDLFGRELKMTQINIADALAVAAVYTMGEGAEGRPLAIVEAPVEFIDLESNDELLIPLEEDLYAPLLLGNLN